MKSALILFVCAFTTAFSFAQTEKAKAMYAEATSGKVSVEEYMKQDFSNVDSTSIHDLGVFFYIAEDYVSASKCWEIALTKVTKFGKAYEKTLECLSGIYPFKVSDSKKHEWLMQLLEEFNQHELTKECNDYACKKERALYFAVKGDLHKTKAYIKEALELCESEEQRIEVEEECAKIFAMIKDYESSAQYYRSAANRWLKLGDKKKFADAMWFAASYYSLVSKYAIAEECARELIEVSVAEESEDGRKAYVKHLNCFGDILYIQGKSEEALSIFQTTLSICKQNLPQSKEYAKALENLAKVQVKLSQLDQAKENLQEACACYKTLSLENEYINACMALGQCLYKAGDSEAAEAIEAEIYSLNRQWYEQTLNSELESLEITQKYLDNATYTNSLALIASCYYTLNNYDECARYYSLYTESLRNMLQETFLMLTEKDRQRVWSEQQDKIESFYSELSIMPDSAAVKLYTFIPTLYDMELISKGIMLNSVIEFEKVLNDLGDETLLETYAKIKENYKQLETLQQSKSNENLNKVLALKQENSTLEQKLMSGCAAYRNYTKYLSYTWRDIQKKLQPGDIAIEFTTLAASPLSKDNYILALIVTDSGEPTMQMVSNKAIIKAMLKKPDLYENKAYYNLFWGLLQEQLKGKQRVYFAADNNLSNIAIEYLSDGSQMFFEKYEVYRLSSTKEICRDYAEPPHQRNIAIFGNIDYNTAKTAEKRGILSFGQLRHSEEEVKGIKSAMKREYKVKVYEKEKATEQQFRQLSQHCPNILHVTSHGAYNGDDKTSETDAMNHSYLALSGINVGTNDAQNDGRLTAADIAQMNLQQCDMAVLSACNTGLGAQGTDGIYGLQRGFKNAGVRSLLMSLNPVYDESSAKLMIAFYQGMAQGKSKRQALLDAQKYIKALPDYKDGAHWASFILLDGIR